MVKRNRYNNLGVLVLFLGSPGMGWHIRQNVFYKQNKMK